MIFLCQFIRLIASLFGLFLCKNQIIVHKTRIKCYYFILTSMNETLPKDKKILIRSIHILGFLSLIASIVFMCLTSNKEIRLSIHFAHGIIAFGLLTSLICFLTQIYDRLKYTAIIMISIFIAAIGCFQQMNISLLFIIPIYLGYCLQSRKKIFFIIFLDLFLFTVSRIFKAYNIYMANPRAYNFRAILVSNLATSITESIIFLLVALPVLTLLIKRNDELSKSLKEKDEATNDILQFCSTATSFHNKYLSVHIKGVRDITTIILDALIDSGVYIDPYYYQQIIFSVQFHDIGKIYIDSSVLDKKGKLDSSEYNLIREHPERGVELFSLLPKNVLDENYIETCKNVILQHHERMDGTGYPAGIKDITFEAKIVAIADVVDALLSWRPYKPPLTWENMTAILEEQKAGFNYEMIKMVYQEKEKILSVSDANNRSLMHLLSLDKEDIQRR